MDCEVAREALSARLDGEREPVPSARVDEHLDECADCRSWLEQITSQAASLRELARSRPVVAPSPRIVTRRPRPMSWRRWALLIVGVAQMVVAVVQALGLNVGLVHADGMPAGGHLLNESTAWSIALGVVMVGAAVWPVAASGIAGVLTVFAGVLTVYVVDDAIAGAVTMARVLTHIPVVLGALLAILVWRGASVPRPTPSAAESEPEITLPHNASRGRRRGHLWPTDGSAA